MSDLILGARLEADGSKLVGQLSAAEAAARGLEGALEGTGQGARQLDNAVDGVGNAATQAAGKARALEGAIEGTGQAARSSAASTAALASSQQQLAVASSRATASAAAQRAGYQQLGFQMQDVFQQVALGINPLVILAQQGGQTASAVALMGGSAEGTQSKFVKFATFLSGPWGAALFGAVTIVGFLVQGLLEAEDATELATSASDGLSNAQNVLGQMFDLTTGKIEHQNDMLRLNAQLMLTNLKMERDTARSQAKGTAREYRAAAYYSAGGRGEVGNVDTVASRIIEDVLSGKISGPEGYDRAERLNYRNSPISKNDTLNAVVKAAEVSSKSVTISEVEKSIKEGVLAPGLRRDPPGRTGSSTGGKPSGTNALQSFGESAAEKVNRVLAEYDPAPRGLDKALQDLRSLDKLIADLGVRKPPDFEKTIASAEEARKAVEAGLAAPIEDIAASFSQVPRDMVAAGAALADLDAIAARLKEAQPPNLDQLLAQIEDARTAVNDSLVRPFRDILADQERGIELQRLAVEGRYEEADQLGLIHGLMRQVGAESEAQLVTELAKRGVTADMVEQMLKNLAVERQLSEEAGRRLEIQQEHLREVDTFRGSIERFFADVPNRGIKALGDFAKNVQRQVSDYFARYLTETLFGGVFRQLEEQMSGRDQVRKANQAYVGEVGSVVKALRALEDAAYDAAAAQGGEIVVTATREKDDDPYRMKSPKELFRQIIGPLLKEIGLDGDLASKIGEQVGIALEGAVIGQTAASLVVGDDGSKLGSQIGGAAGAVIGNLIGGPVGGQIGAAILGTLGSLVGGAFKKDKFGTALIIGAEGSSVQARGEGRAEGATSLGGSVQSILGEIADALDAEIGAFRVSIGTYKDRIKVSTSGREGKLKNKYSDVKDFRDDEGGALAFAAATAIGQGAIAGVSAAVQKALRSSEDIQEALQEALAVREVEDILAGMADDWLKEMRAFEKTAEERLRIGREYGFDLVELEKRNAEERAKLVDDILQSRVGALKDLLEDLTIGDLAEGTLAERRTLLLAEIAKAEKAAETGEEGAAARLAALQRDLIELSYDAYGTAGAEYGADRDQAVNSAERIIALEEERVRNAQAELTERLDQGNALTGETNDLLAEIRTEIARFGLLPPGVRSGGGGIDTTREVLR